MKLLYFRSDFFYISVIDIQCCISNVSSLDDSNIDDDMMAEFTKKMESNKILKRHMKGD